MAAVIAVENFAKSFGDKTVHRNISFTVRKGECLGLVGGSGAGKSVILRSLIGLEKPDSGRVLVDGQDITHMSEGELVEIRKKVAYVFQNGALFDSLSVYENLAYPLREHTTLSELEISKKITDLLKEFGLEGNEETFPAKLSGGMQKRVGLARATIMQPHVVLYDEPTAGLDPYTTKRIQDVMLRLKNRGVTGILVTHDMPTCFAVCDRIAMLYEGEIRAVVETRDLADLSPNDLISRFINGEEP